MKVVVAGVDWAPRPHWASFLTRAFIRLGCDAVRVGGSAEMEFGSGGVDSAYVHPVIRHSGPRIGAGAIAHDLGCSIDLLVYVDDGHAWSVMNDGSAPFSCVWREGNPNEDSRIASAAAGAPIFCCMVGKGTSWPVNTTYVPFGVDRAIFSGGRPYAERDFPLIYTGRERGAGTFGRLRAGLQAHCCDYVAGYRNYADLLGRAKTTYVVDSGRYLGSRGLEAMAQGCVVFWDGGEAFDRAGLKFGVDCLPMIRNTCPVTQEYVPVGGFEQVVMDVCADEAAWTALSEAARATILREHTYEHRAWTIASAVGVTLPKTIAEVSENGA